MKKQTLVLIILMVLGISNLALLAGIYLKRNTTGNGTRPEVVTDSGENKYVYYCPMHVDFTSDKPGSCKICGMDLVRKEKAPADSSATAAGRKILYYRNPMDPAITSPVPAKDQMGMDYVPVYEQEPSRQQSGVYISPQKQQLIGVTKAKVQKRQLKGSISSVGEIAFDTGLYIAQKEYLQAMKISFSTAGQEGKNPLLEAAQTKLLLAGMSREQIKELAASGNAQEGLFFPDSPKVWVYITIFEYEAALIKDGAQVQVTSLAVPGEIFRGKVIGITPIVNSETRSIKARVEVDNTEHKLKPRSYVNAVIDVDLGEQLAVPETAVLDTGLRKLVYVVDQEEHFMPTEVILGSKADGYYEVKEGLSEGQTVVESGNFLVDSESKLKGVLPRDEKAQEQPAVAPAHQH